VCSHLRRRSIRVSATLEEGFERLVQAVHVIEIPKMHANIQNIVDDIANQLTSAQVCCVNLALMFIRYKNVYIFRL
jgi:hypothetical protein